MLEKKDEHVSRLVQTLGMLDAQVTMYEATMASHIPKEGVLGVPKQKCTYNTFCNFTYPLANAEFIMRQSTTQVFATICQLFCTCILNLQCFRPLLLLFLVRWVTHACKWLVEHKGMDAWTNFAHIAYMSYLHVDFHLSQNKHENISITSE